MHPITYSLIINLTVLLVSGLLAWKFDAVWLVIVAIALQTHALQRFEQSVPRDAVDEDDEPGQAMGFMADIK